MSRRDGKSFWKGLRKRLVAISICVGVVLACLGALYRHYTNPYGEFDLISSMENRLLDLRFRLRGARAPSGKVGILAIDEKSLQRFGRWPIARKSYAQVFANLKKLGAEWVGFDVVWSEPERPLLEDVADSVGKLKASTGEGAWTDAAKAEVEAIDAEMQASRGDRSLTEALTAYQKVVLGYIFYDSKSEAEALGKDRFKGLDPMLGSAVQAVILPDGKTLENYQELKVHGIVTNTDFVAGHAEQFAFFNGELSDDAIYRWVQLTRVINGNLMPSLSLKLAAQILGREPVVFFDEVGITDITLMNPENDQDLLKIPVDLRGKGRVLINHLGGQKTIPHFSLADVYDGTLTAAQKKQMKGMSLILGPTAIGINDKRANPFDAAFDGVEQHAAVVDNIVQGKFMRRTDTVYKLEMGLILALGFIFGPIMIFGRAAWTGPAALLFLTAYYYFDRTFWFGKGEWVYMGMPFIEIGGLFVGVTLYKYLTEERERKKVKGAFSLYLAPEVIEQFLENPDELARGSKKEMTIFFSDVRSFTTISEGLSPEKLRELMNDYFTPMEDIIQNTRGFVDKYIGDAIMAFWGAPIPLENSAESAATAAVQMLYALDKLRADFPKRGLPVIDFGIGLNSGTVSVGNMGSPKRVAYTVMGDAVNLASRLEAATKDYGVKIMIGEATQALLKRKDLITRDLDDIRVKGKLQPVRVFELIRPDLLKSETALQNLIGEFHLGREAYRAKDWQKAEKHFVACMQIRPDDGPADLYLRRLQEYAEHPPAAEWDGVFVRKSK